MHMQIIAHRRNSIEQLAATPTSFGIEMDLRSWADDLIVEHDPFVPGPYFSDWLKHYRHGVLIVNTKEEGLEERALALLNEHAIEDFFFLDQSFPFLLKTAKRGESRCAVRVSEYESIETALSLAGMIEWVWVDCFTRMPLDKDQASRLKRAGFKLCLVSPELQGRSSDQDLQQAHAENVAQGIEFDAICTKRPDWWLDLAGQGA
jgi:hypothetical protein